MLKQILILAIGFLMTFDAFAQPVRSADSYYNYGKNLRDQGKYPEAIQAFKKVVALDANYDSAYIEWSKLEVKVSSVENALLVLKRGLISNPKLVKISIALGTMYKDNKSDYDSALIYFSNALKIDNTNKETVYNICWCYNAKQEYDKAISFAEKALALDINYKLAYNELGHSYHASQKYQEAIETFKKYIAISTCDLPLYYCGRCYLELNQFDNVQKMIDELKKMKSGLADALKKRWDMKLNQKPVQ